MQHSSNPELVVNIHSVTIWTGVDATRQQIVIFNVIVAYCRKLQAYMQYYPITQQLTTKVRPRDSMR